MKRLLFAAAVGAATLVAAAAATADNDNANQSGFKTPHPPMLIGVGPGSSVEAIISVGDTLGRYRFESIPDGIALRRSGRNVQVFVNHETSMVPFPYNPSAPTEANSQNDFDNSQLSRLLLNRATRGVLQGRMAIPSAQNWQRFCSNYLATSKEGFTRPILLTNEEGIDWVNRSGKAWPAAMGAPQARQIGTVVAHDVNRAVTRPIWGMGRHNHENSLAVPGYRKPVVLSGDDAFVNTPAQSQVYSYIAPNTNALMADRGQLYAFVSDTPGFDDYFDFTPGSSASIQGHFVRVPKDIATGRKPDGTDLMAADKGYPLPPNDGTWQRDPSGRGVDGPQWVLEYWGDTQPQPVFQFVRIEDMAYDKRPGRSNVVYLVDSGRGTAGNPQPGRSTNGRVWRMVLDKRDPTRVTSLSILIEGDDAPVKTPTEVHQPDNIESTRRGLLLTEDPGSQQQFPLGSTDPNATNARVMRYRFAAPTVIDVVAVVDQSADESPRDVDAAPAGAMGSWESSGVVDASSVFGAGAFLVTVQAHTFWIQKAPGDDNVAPAGPDFTYKREGGQLVLLRIPGMT